MARDDHDRAELRRPTEIGQPDFTGARVHRSDPRPLVPLSVSEPGRADPCRRGRSSRRSVDAPARRFRAPTPLALYRASQAGPPRDSSSERSPLVDALLEKLDTKLREWGPEIAEQVRRQIAEMIDLADRDLLDLVRSRSVEQEVVDLIDEPAPR